jgi:hypothetical protein
MKEFENDYIEPTFYRKESTFNKAEKTVSELFTQPRIKFYRRVITFRRLANQLLRIPQRLEIIKLPERVRVLKDFIPTKGVKKKELKPIIHIKNTLSKNIVTEHRKFKNKTIISVKTDIESRFLKKI